MTPADDREGRLCLSCGLLFQTLRVSDRQFCWRCAPTVPGEREAREAYAVGHRQGVEAAVRLFWQTQMQLEATSLDETALFLLKMARREGFRDLAEGIGYRWRLTWGTRRSLRRSRTPKGHSHDRDMRTVREYRARAAALRRWAEGP